MASQTLEPSPQSWEHAEVAWRQLLAEKGLCPVMVCDDSSKLGECSGVGSSKILFIADYPMGICGIPGVGRFTILAEPGSQRIPCLTPIDIKS